MIRRFRAPLFFVPLLFLFSTPLEAVTLRIDAPKIRLELEPGEVYSGEFNVENPEDEGVNFRLYLEDWVYSKGGTGAKDFSPPKSTPLSCAEWINYSPAEGMIKPFGRQTVSYTIRVPKDARGGGYAVLFAETLLGGQMDEEGVYVNVAARIGALFLVEVSGTVDRRGEIKAVNIRVPEGNRPLEIATTFQNTGNVEITLEGKFIVMDAEGVVRGRGHLEGVYTLPSGEETVTSQWISPRLASGNYQMILTYNLGKGKNLVEERSFAIQ